MSTSSKDYLLTAVLLVIVAFSLSLNIKRSRGLEVEEPDNIAFDPSTNTLRLGSLTLRQKIAQMIVAYGKECNRALLQDMFIGGIYLGAKPTEDDYVNTINSFQDGAVVPFFVTVDLEGCENPFENFQDFPSLKDIETEQEAYGVGYEEGRFLKRLGFSVNFAPVVELEDTVWGCRTFLGTPQEISEKAASYVVGLQKNGIIATAKHYPGRALDIEDPHYHIVWGYIKESNLLPFERAIQNNVSAIMISHVIAHGVVDSELRPSVVSRKVVQNLRTGFTGLVITDEIRMLGLTEYYSDPDQMYVDLFKAENDVILNFDQDPKTLYHMISVVEDAVIKGELSEDKIDNSVVKVLNAKGIIVI